jgi:hypothetical protein
VISIVRKYPQALLERGISFTSEKEFAEVCEPLQRRGRAAVWPLSFDWRDSSRSLASKGVRDIALTIEQGFRADNERLHCLCFYASDPQSKSNAHLHRLLGFLLQISAKISDQLSDDHTIALISDA